MAASEQLGTVALQKQPVYYNDPTLTWEQRLASAYDEASKHLKASIPAGSTIDASQFEAANDAAGNQVGTYGDAWLAKFKGDQDADPATALRLPADQMRQYYLGVYAQASANLGGYLTGYAREQIPLGSLSQSDFDKGAEIRLRQFSQIIHAGRTGQLPALVAGEQYAASKVGQVDSTITVMTPGVEVVQNQATAGLGMAPAWIALIVVGAILAVGGVVVGVYWSSTSASNRRAMLEICQDALKRGDPRATEICANMATVVADMADPAKMPSPIDAIIPKDLQKQLVTYACIGAGAYLLISFAPEIIRSLSKAKSAYSEQQEQIANLARYRKRFTGSW